MAREASRIAARRIGLYSGYRTETATERLLPDMGVHGRRAIRLRYASMLAKQFKPLNISIMTRLIRPFDLRSTRRVWAANSLQPQIRNDYRS